MICYFCHKKIDADYALTKDGRPLHPLCDLKMKELQKKHIKEVAEQRKQRGLYHWLQ